ncbi:hypothetical protein IV417_02565 [Alphaproteobacteria bacterium KMM 3653]|uniref:Uncharacterized protein n=1 Tax=Harenicola maris TaxID=2841044 RepID=A0AAP2CKS2_9RHOB|nr:hypothetical protein [Harenicola maris]
MTSLFGAMPASAEFTLLDQSGAWLFYAQRGVGRSHAACQVVSCVRGTCGSGSRGRTQFSLYDARDGRGVRPEFIAPERVRPGAEVTLTLNGKSIQLRNTFKSPQFYLFVKSGSDAQLVLEELRALEASDANGKFTVSTPEGDAFPFTVRGVTTSLDRMGRRCSR